YPSLSRQPQDLAVCALCDPFVFCARRLRFLSRRALGVWEGYEVALSPIHGEQIRHHFPSYGQRRSVGITLLFLSFIDQGQIMILSGRQLRSFHQHTLNMFVALFGKRGAHHLVGGALFITAKLLASKGNGKRLPFPVPKSTR